MSFTIDHALWIWIAVAVLIFPVQLFVSAPYGRHSKSSWGPMISNRLGWIIMEGWAPVVFLSIYLYFFRYNSYALFFAILYILHYIHRSFIFPFRIRTEGKEMPVMIMLSAMLFNSVNAGVNGYFLSVRADYPENYFLHWNFMLGAILFFGGFAINFYSDNILINLRKPGEKGYKIPHGFLFEYISCPNLFGEMLEWLGYLLMCRNLASLSFFVWTVSNLLPRAIHHHQWYLQKFKDYPKNRKAVFPFLW